MKRDEIYQAKEWSRDKVNVLLRLDETKFELQQSACAPRRVFYSTLGHTNESWKDPDIYKMSFESIKWALGMTEGSTALHAKM